MKAFLVILFNIGIFANQNSFLVNGEVRNIQQPVYESDGIFKFTPRIVGGTKAREGEFRGIVSLQSYKGQHICGGTWIKIGNQSQILTAAHCVMDAHKNMLNRLAIQVMGDDLSVSKVSSISRQIRKVRKIVAHPLYNPVNLANDIAVIFLTSQFTETQTFGRVSIPRKPIEDYQPCRVAGWGKLSENGADSIDLMITNITVIPWKICNGAFSYNGIVGRHAFCAGKMAGGTDSCQGDSGGPLMSGDELIGLVSFGNGCGLQNFPGVYTNVYDYSRWIKQTINSSSLITQSNTLMICIVAASFVKLFFY